MGFCLILKQAEKFGSIYRLHAGDFLFRLLCFYGERGIRKYLYLRHEVEHARVLADQYKARKERLDSEVRLLSPDSLDPDLLDERVRIVLNFVGSDEFVILDEQ